METRRVQMTGGASFMITLPKEWAESVGLRKNDRIGLEIQHGGDLLLMPEKAPKTVERRVKFIDVTAAVRSDTLYRMLIGAYVSGHNMIEVRTDTSISNDVLRTVLSFTQTAIGLEVIEEDDSHILIKDLMDHTEMMPSKNIERIGVIVQRMVADVVAAVMGDDIGSLSDMETRDQEVDRIHWLISRQSNIYQKNPVLCNKTGLELHRLTRHILVSRIIERIGDHAVLVSKDLTEMTRNGSVGSVSTVIHETGTELGKLLKQSVTTWLDQDMIAAERCIEDGRALIRKVAKMTKTIGNQDVTGMFVAGSSKRIAEYCIDISELTINAAMD